MISGNEQRSDPVQPVATVPNAVTVVRMLLVGLAAGLFAAGVREAAAVVLCGIAVALDWVDGQLARRLRQCTRLGRFLDPLADKMAMALIYGVIAINLSSVTVWLLVALIVARDVFVTVMRLWAGGRGPASFASDQFAKVKTTVQGAGGIAVLFYAYVLDGGFAGLYGPVIVIVLAGTCLSYLSAWRYVSRREQDTLSA